MHSYRRDLRPPGRDVWFDSRIAITYPIKDANVEAIPSAHPGTEI